MRFTATPTNGGTTPTYIWKNGGTAIPLATGNEYTSTTLVNGDVITVEMTSNATPCLTGSPATSDGIMMTVNPVLTASVIIAADMNPVCMGTLVTFNATPTNGGPTPAYQWYKGVTPVGTNSPLYAYAPANGDMITVRMTSNASPCLEGSPATSNSVNMQVNPILKAGVSIRADRNPVGKGTAVTFRATPANGGSAPVYEWYKGATPVGTNSPLYAYVPENGDVISVKMTSNAICVTQNTVRSNSISMEVKNNDATLSDLKVNGVTVTGFATSTYIYWVVLPHNTAAVPVLTASTTDPKASKLISPSTGLPGISTVTIVAEDGTTTKAYSVIFSIAADSDASLKDLTVNGVTVFGFAPDKFVYNVILPLGTTSIPVIGGTTNDPNATKTIIQPEFVFRNGVIVVRAEDALTIKTYTINFSIVPPSEDATLIDLGYNDVKVPGFTPGTVNYSVVLPMGTTEIPLITATTNHPGATKVITNPPALPGMGYVRVTAQDGVTSIAYTISFTIDTKSNDASLSDLKVDGTTITGFSPLVLTYYVIVPRSVILVPLVTATTTNIRASKVISTAAALPGTTTIQVTAENGITVLTYQVKFRYPATGIDEFVNLANIQVFPNPSSGNFDLIYTGDESLGNQIEIRILDVVGQEILTLQKERVGFSTRIPIDISHCHSGIYFIQVRNAKERMVKTIIID